MKTWILTSQRNLINTDYVRRVYVHGPDVFADVVESEPMELVRCSAPNEATDTLLHLITSLADPNEGIVYTSPVGNVLDMEGVLREVRAHA